MVAADAGIVGCFSFVEANPSRRLAFLVVIAFPILGDPFPGVPEIQSFG